MTDLAPVVRILLRIWVGYMLAQNWINEEMAAWMAADPDLVSILTDLFSLAVWAMVEFWWRMAKRFGWPT